MEDIESIESLLIDLSTIRSATNNFAESNKLGEGGFGTVYKGSLPSNQEIAVKRLSQNSRQGLGELKNELVLIAKLQHKNLVRLVGVCLQEDEKLLVYEYTPNTSLDNFLFDSDKRKELEWCKRFGIIKGISRGLQYLHEDSQLKIVHRDLKASNILLDADMNPKISDFGLARLFGGDQSQDTTNRVVGTYGYMAPEYALRGQYSIKSDIYSFGVLILEIITGRRNSDSYNSDQAVDLPSFVYIGTLDDENSHGGRGSLPEERFLAGRRYFEVHSYWTIMHPGRSSGEANNISYQHHARWQHGPIPSSIQASILHRNERQCWVRHVLPIIPRSY